MGDMPEPKYKAETTVPTEKEKVTSKFSEHLVPIYYQEDSDWCTKQVVLSDGDNFFQEKRHEFPYHFFCHIPVSFLTQHLPHLAVFHFVHLFMFHCIILNMSHDSVVPH